MDGLIEDYLKDVARRLRTTPAHKEQILRELREHLVEKVEDVHRADPGRDREDVIRAVLHDFGSPRDLALAYDADGPFLRNRTGDVVLRVSRAVGRGTRVVLKWTAISLAVLLVVGSAVGLWTYYEFQGSIEQSTSMSAYHYERSCDQRACYTGTVEEQFYVHPDARFLDVHVTVENVGRVGTVRVTILDPNGNVKFDESFGPSDAPTSGSYRWAPTSGDWEVAYEYQLFTGTVTVDADVTGLPEGTVGRPR